MEIILIRHGKPQSAVNKWLSAEGFAKWIEDYNASNVSNDSEPPLSLKDRVKEYFVVSSDLPRAIHSAGLCSGKEPDLVLDKLREMDVPQVKIPLIISAYAWIILNGILWYLGIHGHVESYKSGKHRAKLAAESLAELAKTQERVAVFGHIVTNMLIAKELLLKGWKGKITGKSFWSTVEFNI